MYRPVVDNLFLYVTYPRVLQCRQAVKRIARSQIMEAQSVKGLTCKCEDLNSDLHKSDKKPGTVTGVCDLSTGKSKAGLLKLTGLEVLLKQVCYVK